MEECPSFYNSTLENTIISSEYLCWFLAEKLFYFLSLPWQPKLPNCPQQVSSNYIIQESQKEIISNIKEVNETLQNAPLVSKIFPFTQIEPFGSYILFPGVSDYETGKNICSKFNSNVLDFTNENYQAKFESVYTGLNLESSSIDYFYIGKMKKMNK